MFKKPIWDYLRFVIKHIIILKISIIRWVQNGHTGMDIVSNNTQVDFKWCSFCIKGPKVFQENIPQIITTTEALL